MTRNLIAKLYRPMIAATLAAGIALTPVSAAPARADSQDTANFIAALVALGIVGAAINNSNKNTKAQAKPTRRATPDRYRSNRDRSKILPKTCLRSFETRYGSERFFAKRCLRNNYSRWQSLPESCALKIRAKNQQGERVRRNVYEPRCLRSAGYKVARR